MKTLSIKTSGRFTEIVYENNFVQIWLFKTTFDQTILIQAFQSFDIQSNKECEVECLLKMKRLERDGLISRNMKLYLETVEYSRPSYKPGEKIPHEMTKEVEKFYWKMKDRDDLTLEEVNALRFIEKQMQNDWKDYLLEEETP